MPSLLDVMLARKGIAEVPGSGNNQIILDWFTAVGHPEVKADATAWCSVTVGSACVEADLPIPPKNINMMAKSWLTWGVAVPLADIQPGDVAVWPRGDPKGWQGHVNVVCEILKSGKIKCVGGNQAGPDGGADAVTITRALDPKGACGFRRGVPATVKDLRAAGSTTIKSADNLEKAGIVATFFTPIYEGTASLFNGVPNLSSVEGLTYWETAGKAAHAVLGYVGSHPVMVAVAICGVAAWTISRINKSGRVAEHAAGIPLSSQVAALGVA